MKYADFRRIFLQVESGRMSKHEAETLLNMDYQSFLNFAQLQLNQIEATTNE